MKRRRMPGAAYAVAIVAFTVYVLLDTFVLQSAWQTGVSSADTSEAFASAQANLQGKSADGTTAGDEDGASDAASGAAEQRDATESGTSAQGGTDDESTSEASGDHKATPGTGRKHGHGPGRHRSQDGDDNSSQGSSGRTGASGAGRSSSTTNMETEATVTDSTSPYEDYDDGNVRISVKEYTVSDTKVYVADVQLTSAEHLKSAFANDTFGKNVTATTSSIAEANDAVLAINGDYYGVQEAGYVIRNGKVWRDTAGSVETVCCIYADGTMRMESTAQKSAQDLVDEGVWQALSFGPALVENGAVSVAAGTEVGRAMASNPRTAIGFIDENHYVFVVSDGRTDESAGLTLAQLADFMRDLGVTSAYNLDGGGSSTMWYQGQVVNNPTTNGSVREREVSDIVYVN